MKETSKTTPARIVKATRRWIGMPYHDQASVRGVVTTASGCCAECGGM